MLDTLSYTAFMLFVQFVALDRGLPRDGPAARAGGGREFRGTHGGVRCREAGQGRRQRGRQVEAETEEKEEKGETGMASINGPIDFGKQSFNPKRGLLFTINGGRSLNAKILQKSGKKKFDADKDIDTSECPTATTPKNGSPAKKSVAAVADKKAKKVSVGVGWSFIIMSYDY